MKKIRILVVEDESIVAKHIKNTLERIGYSVTECVTSAEAALASVRKKCPELVLMDIKLKGKMNGIQAAKKIFQSHRTPVIFLTAYANEKLVQTAKKSEPFGYLVKPFDETSLRTSIEIALYKSKMNEKLRKAHDDLEIKVRERTKDLQATNEALQQEIGERKKAEESRQRILEELNERMKELTSVSYSAKIMKNEMLRSQLEHSHMQEAKHKIFEALQERVKELTLVRNMTKLLQSYHKSLDELMEDIVSILPLGWKYSECAAARFIFDGKETATPNFSKTKWKQTADFRTEDGKLGVIEVYYLEERPEEFEGPFLLEERNLINSLALMLKSYFNNSEVRSRWDHNFLIDHLDDQVWYLMDPETYGAVNESHAQFLGKNRKSVEFRKISQVLAEEDAARTVLENARVFEEKLPVESEQPLTDGRGRKKLLCIRRIPKLDDDGQVEYVICVARETGQSNRQEDL